MNIHEIKQWLMSICLSKSSYSDRKSAKWFLMSSKSLKREAYRKKVELFIVGTNYYNQVLTILNEEEDVDQGPIEYCSLVGNVTRRLVC